MNKLNTCTALIALALVGCGGSSEVQTSPQSVQAQQENTEQQDTSTVPDKDVQTPVDPETQTNGTIEPSGTDSGEGETGNGETTPEPTTPEPTTPLDGDGQVDGETPEDENDQGVDETVPGTEPDVSINYPDNVASFSYALTQSIDSAPEENKSTSTGYYDVKTGLELKKGIRLNKVDPDAQVRIVVEKQAPQALMRTGSSYSYVAPSPERYEVKDFGLKNQSGNETISVSQFINRSNEEEVVESIPGHHTAALKHAESIDIQDNDRVYISVDEPNSDISLDISSPKHAYVSGEKIYVKARIVNQAKMSMSPQLFKENHPLKEVDAELISPVGDVMEVTFQVNANHEIEGEIPLPEYVYSPKDGLYELKIKTKVNADYHIEMQDGQRSQVADVVQRQGKLLFALAKKTAQLQGQATLQNVDGHWRAEVPLDVFEQGRFEVLVTLYGQNVSGEQPIMITHSAADLLQGEHVMPVAFDATLLQASGFKPPYLIKQVILKDQTNMAKLETRDL